MATENEVLLRIRGVLHTVPPGASIDTLAMATLILAETGDDRAVEDVRALIRIEAAALGIAVADDKPHSDEDAFDIRR